MSEFGIADAKTIAKKLEESIKNSTDNTQENEDLLGLINVLLNMPNLLREKKTLDNAISKNRGILDTIEAEVSRETIAADSRIKELKAQVLAEEARLTDVANETNQSIREITERHNIVIDKETIRATEEIKVIRNKVKVEEEELASITSETDAAKARLKIFQENVAKMNVSDE